MPRPKAVNKNVNDRQDDSARLLEALDVVTQSLNATSEQLSRLAGQLTSRTAGATAPEPQIDIWEDDPFSEAVASPAPAVADVLAVPVPSTANPRLRIAIVESEPPAGRYSPGTAEFRYWLAKEALARGIAFWGGLLPAGTTWSTSNPMRVQLLEPLPDLNAKYARLDGLHFFRQTVEDRDIYSGDSPDVVLHELGHAVLDAVKPQLFHAASTETGAFHESFGDMSAILCALQLPTVRARVLEETGGRLNVNSRLSRLAEQLGWGIRQISPWNVDRDSLRNAANRFFYRPVDSLPPSAPANLLSRQAHSFSRVFTGAFLEALAGMFASTGTPNETNLLTISRDMGQLLADAVHVASVAPAYFSQVAAAMVQADRARFGGRYGGSLARAFVHRGILSVESAMTLGNEPVPALVAGQVAGIAAPEGTQTMLSYAEAAGDSAYAQGMGETPDLPRASVSIGAMTVEVHAPSAEPLFASAMASASTGPSIPLGQDTASRIFLEGLIQRGEVDLSTARGETALRSIAPSLRDQSSVRPTKLTHFLSETDGALVLKRSHFNCGFCEKRAANWSCG